MDRQEVQKALTEMISEYGCTVTSTSNWGYTVHISKDAAAEGLLRAVSQFNRKGQGFIQYCETGCRYRSKGMCGRTAMSESIPGTGNGWQLDA